MPNPNNRYTRAEDKIIFDAYNKKGKKFIGSVVREILPQLTASSGFERTYHGTYSRMKVIVKNPAKYNLKFDEKDTNINLMAGAKEAGSKKKAEVKPVSGLNLTIDKSSVLLAINSYELVIIEGKLFLQLDY